MTSARDILNKLTWDKRFSIDNYAVVFVHRGAPHDLKVVRGNSIREIGKIFFMIEEDTMIPFHRVRAIRDLRSGEDIYTKNEGVPFPLDEIEGHEGLGEFQDKVHSVNVGDSRGSHGSAIRCGARLSYPEDDPGSFRERAMNGAKMFGLVELSFFHYSGLPEESYKYESMVDFAGKVIAESHLNVVSLHLPNVNILNQSRTRRMLDIFLPFCTQAGCHSMVVHPGILDLQRCSRKDRDQARSKLAAILRAVSGEIEESDVTLSIETYPEKNRVPSGALDINDFVSRLAPHYCIAYDTSHTVGDTDSVIEDILHNIKRISVFHFSNRNEDERHIPVFASKGDLNFLKIIDAVRSSGFRGMIILEYQPKKYRTLLERDLRMLEKTIKQN
jgi:uncharacterized protein (UPF0248 family)/sugar phosphate isomerase/epimerase